MGVLDKKVLDSKPELLFKDSLFDNTLFEDSTQLLSKDLLSPEPTDTKEKPTYVLEASWVTDITGKTKSTFLPYKEDDFAYLKVKYKTASINKRAIISICDSDSLSPDDSILITSILIKQEVEIYQFNIDGATFSKGYNDVLKLFVRIIVDKSPAEVFCNSADTQLKINVVRYIPSILEANNLPIAASLQKRWFNNPANDDWQKHFDINNLIKIKDFLKIERFKTKYEQYIKDKIWLNTAGKNELIKLINLELKAKSKILPTDGKHSINFGSFENKIIATKTEKGYLYCPVFNSYSSQSRKFTMDFDDDPIDELLTSLGTFELKFTLLGFVKLQTNGKYKIEINTVGIFIEDQFEFSDSGLNLFWSQDLGSFNLRTKSINKTYTSGYYVVDNKSYRRYREVSGKGQDFGIYSDLVKISSVDSFESEKLFDSEDNVFILKNI